MIIVSKLKDIRIRFDAEYAEELDALHETLQEEAIPFWRSYWNVANKRAEYAIGVRLDQGDDWEAVYKNNVIEDLVEEYGYGQSTKN